MKKNIFIKVEDVDDEYASAHNMHYKTKDIAKALGLYEKIITAYPETKEAGYARSQVQNIVNSVVSKEIILNSLIGLVRSQFDRKGPLEAEPVTV